MGRGRAVLALLTLAGVSGLGYLIYQRTGPVPERPTDFETLDPLVRERIDEQIARIERTRRSSGAWLRLGMIYEANGLFGDAARAYQHILTLRGDHARALHRLACVHERLGDLSLAAGTMERAAEAEPAYAPSWWKLAGWRIDLGELEAADDALARARALTPADPAVRFGAVRLALARKEPDAAVALIESTGLLEGPQTGYAQHLLALARRLQGDLEGAAAAQAASEGRKPSFPDPWGAEMERERTGYAALRLQAGRDVQAGRYARAEPALKAILAHDPADLRSLNMLAVCRLEQGDAAEALALLEELLGLEPENHGGAVNAVRALLRLEYADPERLAEADERLRRALAARPEDAGGWRALAALAEARDRPDELLAALDRAITLEPNATDLPLKAAYTVLQLGRTDDALARFRSLQAAHPELTEAWFGEATTLLRAGRGAEAGPALRALSERPDADRQRLAALKQAVQGQGR